MQKLIRLAVIYTAAVTTILLVITLFTTRDSTEKNKKAQANIDSLKQELQKITAYQQSQKEIVDNADKKVLGENKQASDSSKITSGFSAKREASGFITINDKKWQTVDVYENNSYSSKVVGKIEFDKVYRYLKKDGSWYQIVLPKTEANGWVAGRFLREVADNGPQK